MIIRGVLAACALAVSACAPAPAERLQLTVRGHQELTSEYLPWFIGDPVRAGVCVTPPLATDTSRWRGRVFFDSGAVPEDFRAPAARAGVTLCFDHSLEITDDVTMLCLETRDDLGTVTMAAGCKPVRASAHDASYAVLLQRQSEVLTGDSTKRAASSLALATEAEAQGFVVTALRLTLIAAHFARSSGDGDQRQRVAARLQIKPAWTNHASAHAISGQYFYELAMAALARSDLPSAWAASGRALRHFDAIADPKAIVAHTRRAHIIDHAGAPTEARRRLASAISDCAHRPCTPALLRDAQTTLAWWLMQDPDADVAALDLADELLRQVDTSVSGLETANVLLNHAYLNTRRGHAAGLDLQRAQQMLTEQPGPRAEQLRRWSRLIRAEEAAQEGNAQRVLALSDALLDGASAPSLAAQAHSLRARSLRRAGKLPAAAAELEAAIAQYRRSDTLNTWLPLSPGRQAQNYYLLALTAVEQGDHETAWRWLEQLDRESSDACIAAAQSLQAVDALSAAMDQVERAPASRERQAQRAQAHAHIRQRQIDDMRERDECDPVQNVVAAVAWRAFAAADQIVLLTREPTGEVALARRTTMPREQLLAKTALVDRMLNDPDVTDREWREATVVFAEALLPRTLEDLSAVTRVALHGHLQRLPLAALPAGAGWLAEHTVVLTATGPGRNYQVTRADPEQGVFVVDPLGNLPSGQRAAAFYRQTFPTATVMYHDAATVAAVRKAAGATGWLHVDAHGELDDDFVELFALRMADGALSSGAMLAQVSQLWLANLSGCLSGRWSLTADSGQWGLAGRMARAGVPWVIGSRSQLDDAAADDFNRAFYLSYRSGASVVQAYDQGIATLRERYPASVWAALLLMGGQSDAALTPTSIAQPDI